MVDILNITLLTTSSAEYWPILKLTAQNKLEYCLKHEIQLNIRKHSSYLNMQQMGIERQEFMIDALNECDWLFFMGADTLIMNQTIDARDIIKRHPHNDFIIGKDVNGINNDVFFIRNCAASFNFLRCVKEHNLHVANDQMAMNDFIGNVEDFNTIIVSQREFNSYLYSEYHYPNDEGGSFHDGDFVLHLPGISNPRRKELIKIYIDKVIKK